MHFIVIIICVPLLVTAVISITVMLPFDLLVQGPANWMPGAVCYNH